VPHRAGFHLSLLPNHSAAKLLAPPFLRLLKRQADRTSEPISIDVQYEMSSSLFGRSTRPVARPRFIATNDFAAASDMGTILRCAIGKLF
jgi:hypothetical protein